MANKKQKKPRSRRNVYTTLICGTKMPIRNRKLEKEHLYTQFRNFGPISKFRLNSSHIWVTFETATSAAKAARAKIRTLSGYLIWTAFEKPWRIELIDVKEASTTTTNGCCNASEPMVTDDKTFSQYSSSEEADKTDESIIEDCELENVEGITITESSITLHPIDKTVKKLRTEFFPALRYLQCDYEYDLDLFEEFIKCNTNLETVTLKKTVKLLPIVAKYCTKLRKLDILLDNHLNVDKGDVSNLHIFPHLREITLRCHRHQSITKLLECLQTCKSLEYIQVHNALGSSEFVETLSKVPKFRYLVLVGCSNLQNLNWLKNARKMRVIKVKYDKIIDSPICNLKKLVNECVDLSVLDIDLTFDKVTCKELEERPRDKLKISIYKPN